VTVARECPLCGGAYTPSAIRGLLACGACGFVTADVSLTHQELEQIYSAAYFRGEEYRDYVGERALLSKQFQLRMKALLRYVPATRRQSLFEIGAAYGFFLDLARRYFDHVGGIDLSRDAALYASEVVGVPVAAGDFLEHPPQGPFDAVCMWDTIEHLAQPALYIERVATLLRPGGVLAITTGDIGSPLARWRKEKWRQIHPPSHLHYFSKRSLRLLLAKHGFEIRYEGYAGCYRSVDTIAYILLSLKRERPGLYRKLKASGMLNWSFYSNLYDILYVIAQKR
jgi:2-polyprenyl-3-methyl-5-hydroxy-6-metoxy-1,4-benzoquinol methylase